MVPNSRFQHLHVALHPYSLPRIKHFILTSTLVRCDTPAHLSIGELLTFFVKNTYKCTFPPSHDSTVDFCTKPLRRTRTGCVGCKCLSWFPRACVATHPTTALLARHLFFCRNHFQLHRSTFSRFLHVALLPIISLLFTLPLLSHPFQASFVRSNLTHLFHILKSPASFIHPHCTLTTGFPLRSNLLNWIHSFSSHLMIPTCIYWSRLHQPIPPKIISSFNKCN